MSDIWNENDPVQPQVNKTQTVLSIEQLQQLQSSSSSAHMEVELCYSGKKAFIRPLKVVDKKEVLKAIENKNEVLVNKVFDEIIQKYVEFEDPNLNYETITLQERFQILTYIRTANGDKEATVAHECKSCKKITHDLQYDTSELYLKTYKGNREDQVITIDLDSNSKIEILIEPLTRIDEKNAERYCKNEKLDTLSEKSFIYIAASIRRIKVVTNGETQNVDLSSFDKKVEYYKTIDGKTDDKIKDVIKKFDFGIKMPVNFTCKYCKHKEFNDEVNIASFFIS